MIDFCFKANPMLLICLWFIMIDTNIVFIFIFYAISAIEIQNV